MAYACFAGQMEAVGHALPRADRSQRQAGNWPQHQPRKAARPVTTNNPRSADRENLTIPRNRNRPQAAPCGRFLYERLENGTSNADNPLY